MKDSLVSCLSLSIFMVARAMKPSHMLAAIAKTEEKKAEIVRSPLFEIARLLVRFDHAASSRKYKTKRLFLGMAFGPGRREVFELTVRLRVG